MSINDSSLPSGAAEAALDSLDIAIVGISCRLPGASNLRALWELLVEGREGIRQLEDAELDRLGVPAARRAQPGFVAAAPLVDEADCFDAAFFGYSPADAAMMDPQHRVFLETAWHALEDAGHGAGRGAGVVGVFAGTSLSTYLLFNLLQRPALARAEDTFPAMVANDKDFLATRLSYHLGLEGPSVDVQTGCSTSLVAVHLACQNLLTFECDTALAGGVSLHLPQRAGYVHTPGGIASADGHCRAYDASGTGTVFGSGVAVVALRRLVDAQRDGDPIYAVIKGTAINNDGGRKVGFTAPSVEGQIQVIRRALAVANVEASSLGMIEGHGTGTQLGDPVELTALQQVLTEGGASEPRSCVLTAIKSNIGHPDAAAGVAGLIKAALALQHAVVPATVGFQTPNPGVDWGAGPLYVSGRSEPWPQKAGPRRAGVSAFGIGGTNAHAVLEQAPPRRASTGRRRVQLVPLSARTPEALGHAAERLAEHLQQEQTLAARDVAWTLQVGRAELSARQIVVGETLPELVAVLRDEQVPGNRPRSARAQVVASEARRVGWIFPGGGAQYVGMGAGLWAEEPVFRAAFEECARLVLAHRRIDLVAAVYGGASSELTRPSVALPALFAVEYALAQLWRAAGVAPVALAGHSMGEYVAACLAGVFSLESALELVAERGRLFESLPPGGMISVSATEEQLAPLLGAELAIAAINGPAQCVVAGELAAVEALAPRLVAAGIDHRMVPIDVAAHSPAVEPILAEFERFIAGLPRNPPSQPFVSGVTGTWISADDAQAPAYWARHLRATVRFHDVLRTLLDDRSMVLVEVGPGRSLGSAAMQALEPAQRGRVVSSMRARNDQAEDVAEWLMGAGRLWLAGVELDWAALTGEGAQRVSLPGYPFVRARHWLAPEGAVEAEREDAFRKHPDPARWTYVPSWRRAPATGLQALGESALIVASGGDRGLARALATELEGRGLRVSVARSASAGSAPTMGEHVLPRLADRASYSALLSSLGARPSVVVHLGELAARASDEQEAAFYSPLHLAQALEEQGQEPVRLLLVTGGACAVRGDEELVAERALALGPCRVLPLESEALRVSLLDLELALTAASQAEVAAVVAELVASGTQVAALRGAHRWIESFESLPVVAAKPELRERGVYLITGGTGDLGLALAEHLAARCRARLVLVGRSALPPRAQWAEYVATHHAEDLLARRIAGLQRIEAAGGEVMVRSADTSDAVAMAALVREVRAELGAIHGVVHAAGIPASGAFQLRGREAAAAVLAAKVGGAAVLRELFAPGELDFLMAFSSRSAVLGDLGQIDHCAANAVLDALAALGDRDGRAALRALAWDAWKELGQAVTTELPPALAAHRELLLEHALTTTEGLELWDRALATSASHLIISTQHLPTLAREHHQRVRAQLAALADTTRAGARRQLSDESYVPPTGKLEASLSQILGEALGIDKIGATDNFFDLGGNSLIALRVTRAVRAQLGIELPPTALFEAPTVQRLAALLAPSGPAQEPSVDERRERGARRRERQTAARRHRQ